MNIGKLNYIIEAENNDIMIWSIGISNYMETGQELLKVVMIPRQRAEKIEDVLKLLNIQAEEIINLHETKYGTIIKTLKIKNTQEMVKIFLGECGKDSYDSGKLIGISSQFKRIKNAPRYVVDVNENCMKVNRPDFLIVETDAVTVKVPSKFDYPNAGHDSNWDYDYLLQPNQNMDLKSYNVNQKVLDMICESLGNSEEGLKIKEFKIPENIHLFDGYTPNRYELLRKKMRDVSLRTKALINVIRDEEIYKVTSSEYYGVYQESRMARENKTPYTEIKYNSTYSREITFPSLFREIIKLEPSQYDMVNIEELERFANSLESVDEEFLKDDLKIIIEYIKMKKMQVNNIDIMREYEKSEKEREETREQIFLANLSMVGNLETLIQYLGNVYCNASISLFDFGYTLGKEPNIVKLSFNYKEVLVIDEDSIGVSSACSAPEEEEVFCLDWTV